MRIAVLPADDFGCGHYRLMFPALALIREGADVVIDRVGPTIVWDRPWQDRPSPTHKLLGFHKPYEADVVVMQRPATRWWCDMIPHFHAQGTKVVVDVDDLFDQIDGQNVAKAAYAREHSNDRWIDRACQQADVVTCTTEPLLKRYGYGHGVVLPNLVPEAYLNIFGLKLPNTIGWAGQVGVHPGDLQITEGAIASVVDRSDWRFHVVGDGVGVRENLKLQRHPTVTGYVDFREYQFAVARLELGIVPLEPTTFNGAKSALKASEMAALGVPVIMSPTPDNRRLNKLGVGVLAESRSQWKRQIEWLTKDAGARYELAEQGREVMATQTYERHCDRWAQAWAA